jgi:two-component system sensor histidine kinase/response regulator
LPSSNARWALPIPASSAPSLTILLAEDNAVNQALAVRLLQKRGHKVVIAETGRAVLGAIGKQFFDLVLMDIQMPEMDGLEATRAIRKIETLSGAHLPILAMTANAMVGDKELCMEAGMDGYLTKPLSAKDLFAAIEALPPAVQPVSLLSCSEFVGRLPNEERA